MAAPPAPPLALETNVTKRRLRGKQPGNVRMDGGSAVSGAGSSTDNPYTKCERCGVKIKQISMAQHDRLYCPMREVNEQPGIRKNRQLFRPPPPKANVVVESADAEGKADMPKAPYVHVRWCAAVPQDPRLRSSVPSAKGHERAPPREKRTSQAPPLQIVEGCWGGCARCNRCNSCNSRTCNGAACRKCRR